ncbi:MAG TPA: protein-glutamate O-methyltransferase CheR [Allosphingosinicella sp.]|nr:protein-glutamate O-methyltransferase CheR [Allosphingosinicella sp.]
MSGTASAVLAELLELRTGQQLGSARRWRIETALKSLMRERRMTSLEQLVANLAAAPDGRLSAQVVDALLNNETFFYRDRGSFDLLLRNVLPRFRTARAAQRRLRIWCAGCSTGQEAYSLAMHFAEDGGQWADWRIDLLGTDVSGSAIEAARSGLYSQFEVQRGLPVLQMIRWFEEEPGHRWRIGSSLRESVCFEVHNLLGPPPRPIGYDIILCRNVLLYFPEDTRRLAFARLAEASAPDACLMLGAGETSIGQTDDFVPDPDHRGLYLRAPEGRAVAARRRASA